MNGNGNRLLAEFVSDGSLKIQNGFPCGKWNDKGVGILHLRPFNISNCGQIDLASTKFVETDKKLDNYLLREGDVIFNNTNSEELVGKTAYWDRDEQSVLSNHMTILRVLERDALDPQFLAFFLLENWFERHFEAICRRHVNQASVNTDRLGALELPPFEASEQKKIAHILSTVQRAIQAQERIIQTTTELKKTLMHKLFTEGLRNEPQKQTEIGLMPESWETATVEAVCTIKASAMSYKQLEDASNVPNGIRVVGIKVSDMNLPDNEIEFRSANLERFLSKKEALKRTVPDNSIVFPKRGAAIATNKKRLTISRTVLDPNLIAVIPSEAVNHRYLFHWFNTFDLKKITDPGPTPQLNKKDIAPLKFPMPLFAEQEAIAVAIDAAEEKTTLNGRKRDQLKDLFRTLLHELMTAKIRVHDLNFQEK